MPAAATLGILPGPSSIRDAGRRAVGRDRGRRRPQRLDLRGLPGAGGQAGARARGPPARRRRVHAAGGLAGLSHLAVCLPGRAAPSPRDRRARDGRLRLPVAAGRRRACSFRSTTAPASSSGTTTTSASRKSAAWHRRRERLASVLRRETAAARRPSSRGRRRSLDRSAPTRDELESRIAGDDEARKMLFDWSMVECLEHFIERRAPAVGLHGTGGDRHVRQPS